MTVMQRFWRALREFAAGVDAANALAHNKTPSEESVARVRQREFWKSRSVTCSLAGASAKADRKASDE